ncbi:beta-lactamase family protein [Chryseobacterium chendengshani]|uniref:serine hydrolase domain-containing protein n=2 Tax=Chryseobacterium sp. LJ668 TaxID=2864040 RepID=UPI001C6927EE|nr:serine hydrolase [Chryseobacterium sp. LJ668]MBW8523096.1 beta-lactamase family protein [Chryseobacterium sp. LJ668]QYK16623.1 beta-lactamase family protein [Chryseobacterium sp. LJ668]
MKRILITILLTLFCIKGFSQSQDLVKTDGITNNLHRYNIGKVTFMNGNIPLDQYKQADFLTSFPLTYKSDLNIRVFMENSIANYLHQLAPELSSDELLEKGNLQFSFFVDHQFIYKDNISPGCWIGNANELKNTLTTFRIPLTSSKGENLWALHLWERFQLNGGENALKEGKHQLKIEIRPYFKIDEKTEAKVGKLIAEGQVELVIETPKATAKQIAIPMIQHNSDWKISDFKLDKKKIEALNKEIVTYNLKEITSIVVINDGKLLLEEYFNGADRNTLHDPRSAGKSFVSTLMGIAIKDGYIKDENQTLNQFYNLKNFENYNVKKEQIKIKDLLTMSSSFEGSDANSDSPGNEENMYPTDNWVKFTLDLPVDDAKNNGGKWDYFTAGTIILGDILDKKVPGGLEKYADEKLFKPLNIKNYQWQYTPQNVANTAGSLQMTSLDYAKYAVLYKNNGIWNGKQILPQDWVQKTFTHQIKIPERENEFYSYLFWNKTVNYKGKNYETYYCAGNGGNEFIIFKDLPIVIIITAKAYNKPYGHPQAEKIVRDFILPAILK